MALLTLVFFSLLASTRGMISSKIGINYGQLGKSLPSPARSIELIKSMKAGRVKLYNTDPEILKLLSRTKIQASIMVPNQEISNLASNQIASDQWVQQNVLPFYPQTQIRFLLVGNEILSYPNYQTWYDLVPAMTRIKHSLKSCNVTKIKVGTPLAMDAFQMTFPPSNGRFRTDVVDPVMKPLLNFLNRTNSFFFVDVYPYFPWAAATGIINLDYALFRGNYTYSDPISGLVYTNLLDQMLDSVFYALSDLGYPNIPLVIAETGWPNAGDIYQPEANVVNAATYNQNLVKKMTAKPPIGTPARPGTVIPTFIFSLYDEDQKEGPETERHWGLLDRKGEPNYKINMGGRRSRPNHH